MTNREWRRCDDPAKMVEALADITTDRKARLYLCAGCREIWGLLYDDSSREVVEIVERYVEGQADARDLARASYIGECPTFGTDFEPGVWREWECYRETMPQGVLALVKMGVLTYEQLLEDEPEVDPVVKERLHAAAWLALRACEDDPFQLGSSLGRNISRVPWPGAWLVRCIFGKPFRPPILLETGWLSGEVISLASVVYEQRAFHRMPMLGHALERAGCRNDDILRHCRSKDPHARGCWVVDLILGRC